MFGGGLSIMKRLVLLLLFATVSTFVSLRAQDTATIVGSVSDPTGSAIPNARVMVSNPDKGFTRQLLSNTAGEYTAAKVPIGDYVITAEAPGFQKLVRSGITLSVGQVLRVDLQMKVGQVSEQVTVIGNVPHVQTETATMSEVVTGTQIQNLELNGRNFTALALLVPGASPDNSLDASHVGITANLNIAFNGSRMQYNNWELDGGPNVDETSGTTTNTFPNLDSIAEFRISTSNYGADLGKHAGAVIEVATKSGTKEFHGTAAEFVRNDHFDANNWFVNRQISPPGGNAPKTPLKWNDYSYTVGGPLYIPGKYNTDQSKTFFFWSQNWRAYRQGEVISAATPSSRMRQGDFSECDQNSVNFNPVVASGCVLPVNPATGKLFPNDVVPIDPNAQAMLNGLVPLPNNGVIGYLKAPTVPTNWREEQVRVDQNISEKTAVFARYTQDSWNSTVVPSLWTGSSYDTVATKFLAPTKSAVLHVTHTFKPSLMNEFVMGYTNDFWHIIPTTGPGSPARSIYRPSAWSVGTLFPPNAKNPLLPAISVSGGLPFSIYEDESVVAFSSQPIINGKDNIVWSVGKHTIKGGFFLQYLRSYAPTRQDTQGIMSFGTSNPVTTGNALADMYLGRLQQYTEATAVINGTPTGGLEWTDYRQMDFEPYFQDDWKVSPRLTLNLGLRYYFYTVLHDAQHPTVDADFDPSLYNSAAEALLQFDPVTGSPVLVRNSATGNIYDYRVYGNGLIHCNTGGIPEGCEDSLHKSIGPRFGFAYDLTGKGKTVVRGGYGMYYEMGNFNESNAGAFAGNPPAVLVPSIVNVVGYNTITAPPDLLTGPIAPASIFTVPRKWNWPSTQQFNLNLQHEFSGNNLLTVGYVGGLGRHLARERNLNQVLLGATSMNVPALAGFAGVDSFNPSNTAPMCDGAGNCDVQRILINSQQPTLFFVPYRGYNTIFSKEDTAASFYHALQINFRHTTGYGLTFQTAYTWSHSIDDATSTYFENGVDDYHLSRWRGTSDLNRTQMLVLNYIYQLPFFKSQPNRAVRTALGGWSVSGITSFYSGEPVDFGCGINGLSSGVGQGVRCNSLGAVKIHKGVYNDPQFGPTPTWIDPSVIGEVRLDQLPANNQPGMFGTMGRNPLTGPGRNNWDLALLKDFQFPWFGGEHSTLQFRWETFNTFNHPQWNSVSVFCSGATLPGQPCTGSNNIGNGEVAGAWSPRVMQLGLKLVF
jgi:carboxypeptidase family protein